MTGNWGRLLLWVVGAALLSGSIYLEAGLYQQELDSDQLWYRRRDALTRRRRNVLFPSGVRLCAHETVDQAVANHLNYFHLRVCQETMWEAFKVFWYRLPERDVYQDWVGRCMDGSVSVVDIGSFFSQSQEHISLIKRAVLAEVSPERDEGVSPDVTAEDVGVMMTEAPAGEITPDVSAERPRGTATEETSPAPSIGNEIDDTLLQPLRPLKDLVVDLSIRLRGESYTDSLRDPGSFHYQQLARRFTRRVNALQRLPGFKNVHVVEFRGLAVLVHYTVTLEVDSRGIANNTLDFISLQNNLVEKNYPGASEQPTIVYTITDLRNYITEALHKDSFMTNSSLESGTLLHSGALTVVKPKKGPVTRLVLTTLYMDLTWHSKNIEDEGFILSKPHGPGDDTLGGDHAGSSAAAPPPPGKPQTDFEFTLDDGSGSGFSGDAQGANLWSWHLTVLPDGTDLYNEGDGSLELLPPLDLEETGNEDENEEGVVAESPTSVKDNVALMTEEFTSTSSLGTATVLAIEESEMDSGIEEPFLDQVLVTPHSRTDLTMTQAPVFSPEGTLIVELSMQTVEASSIYDDYSLIELHTMAAPITDRPEPAAWIREAPVVSQPTDSAVKLQETTQLMEVTTAVPVEPPVATAASESDVPEEKEAQVLVTPEVPDTDSSTAKGLHTSVEVRPDTGFLQTATSLLQDVKDDTHATRLQSFERNFSEVASVDISFDVFSVATEGNSSSFSSGTQGTDLDAIALPTRPGKALTVFFSLRVTNMAFSVDLFNKSSPEYKALEQRFLELLVPYLQSNLNNFQNLEILNFRNGSIVVNSRMKFGKPVPRGVTSVVYLILEDFANTAYQTMNLAIDKYSLDVESGDRADPCKFQACNEFSRCMVNQWSGEAECVCDSGHLSVNGLPCQSICEVQHDFCLNDGKCDIIPGKGAICRCRVGENWWYRGEHCEEYVSESLVVGIAIASVAGFLLMAACIIIFLARTLREHYGGEDAEDPLSVPTLERATKFNPMFESGPVTAQHYCPRYSSSVSADASKDLGSDEIRHMYQNSTLSKEEIQERLRILELCARDQHFSDFVRQTQV
uniref:SEA domain-containing protein n=1 Tax=Monopterus albus TaxID=43700 RepID=A0A3Q3Q6Y5_MONAL